ncbi:cilia- and flagella-associated protein 99-like [Diadema antillarum]|uniref:cilia- and flagella-associated protein 99-like n=1 Tax=Diadema antillarum TaxID=105358 RepID=UPI003A89485C
MNNHAALLSHCVTILDSFDPTAFGVDQHVNRYLTAHELGENEQSFITEVFAGCVRHGRIMEVVVKAFYVRDGRNCLRADKNLYTVLCYLALYRLDELGMANFRKFIRSQDVNKMHKFLAFSFNETYLTTWMKDEWTKIYESSYVQVELVSPILRWLPEIGDLVEQLADKLANKSATRQKTKTPTDIKPFNLTQPRPRSVPVPEVIPKVKKSKPVPKSTYVGPREDSLVQEAKERNRKRAEETLLTAAKSQFSCANTEKSEKTRVRQAAILQEEESKLQFNKVKARKPPQSVTSNVPIKLNMAAILREGQLYQKKEEDEMKKLEMLEAGAKDATQFLDWQTAMRQRDTEEQLAEIERRRLEGKLSHEEAILARQALIKDNKEKVQVMKKEAEKMMAEYVDRRMKEEEVMKQVVEDIISGHQNAKQAKVKVQEYKKKIVEEVSGESKELLRQALEEAEAEMRRKIDLIQQIRALEAAPKDRTKLIDWTATAGHALLSEMSIAELNERLSLMRISREEERETKRDEILGAKEAKDRLLMDKLQQISKHRAAEGHLAAMKLENKRKAKLEKEELKDAKLLDLQARLEQRKQERLKATEEMKISPTKQSARRTKELTAQKKKNEDSRWKELEKRREKQASLQAQGIKTDVAGQRLNSFGRSRQMATGAVIS